MEKLFPSVLLAANALFLSVNPANADEVPKTETSEAAEFQSEEDPSTTTTLPPETTTTATPETTNTTLEETGPKHCDTFQTKDLIMEPDGDDDGGFVFRHPETGEVCIAIKPNAPRDGTQVLGTHIERDLPRTGNHTMELVELSMGALLLGTGLVMVEKSAQNARQ